MTRGANPALADQAVVVRRLTETRAQLDASLLKNRLEFEAWVQPEGLDLWAVLVKPEHLQAAREHLRLPASSEPNPR